MRIVEFDQSLTMVIDNKELKIAPKHMYLFADVIQESFKKRLLEVIKQNNSFALDDQIKHVFDKIIKSDNKIEDVLESFDFTKTKKNDPKFKKPIFPIVLRTGGIGDLIALSSICYNIPNLLKKQNMNLKFVSQEKYRAVFDWYKKPIQFISYFSPVARYEANNAIAKNNVNKKIKPIFFEGVIENSKENQFNVQYDTIGIDDFNEEWGRPMLSTKRINNKPSNIDFSKPSIIINCRSTAIIRSMRFQDIYESVIKCIGNKDVNIYTHERNLVEVDKTFIEHIKDERIKVISAKSLGDFLLDLYDASLTISVDTAMFHFREGVEKPAIGLYGPFPYESRTKYYKYTKSLNIKSDCPFMPCFIHVRKPDAICEFQKKLIEHKKYDKIWNYTAPCCCNEQNKTVQDQIVREFKEYINSIL